jgi:hypothetical protein
MLDALTDLRNGGEIPWDAIVDETRSLADFTGFRSIATGLDEYMSAIRIDPWDGAAPLILTESRSLAGVLRALTQEYAVMIAPTNGQTAGFLHNGVAPCLRDGMRVLYLGDYDLAGADIEDNTRRVLERYRARLGAAGAHGGSSARPSPDSDHQDRPAVQERRRP